MIFSFFLLLGLTNVELLPVTASDVFSVCEERCVAIVFKEPESNFNVFGIAWNIYDQIIILRLFM